MEYGSIQIESMRRTLRPCPFCGKEPHIVHQDNNRKGDELRFIYWVRCNNPACIAFSGGKRVTNKNIPEAVKQWNAQISRTDEEMLAEVAKIRIVSIKNTDEFPDLTNTIIRDVETGEMIPNVSRLELTLDAEDNKCNGVIYQVTPIKVKEIEQTITAEIKEEDKKIIKCVCGSTEHEIDMSGGSAHCPHPLDEPPALYNKTQALQLIEVMNKEAST